MKKSIFILSVVFSFVASAQIQISTTGNYTNPSYLIDNILIGDGVLSSNHNYIGDPSQIGFFKDSLGLIGMDSGFVLSTGRVDSIGTLGLYSTWGGPLASHPLETDFSGTGDADLLTIANSVPALIGQIFTVNSTHDAAILEFYFVPSSDTVHFNYVFASEEYLDFVNSAFNDVFAFLISGPGITGPYAAPAGFSGGAMNIAEVPNSNPSLPITVSTINNTTSSQYYNHDTLALVSAFNGYTDVFTATAEVTACQTYHIKLAISDGSDGTLDSGVLFEAGSFNSIEPGAPSAIVTTTDALCNGDSSGTATLCVQGGAGPYTVNWNGINPNAISAGIYSVVITDANGLTSSPNYTINESTILSSSINQPIFDLEANVIGGTPSYTFQWLFANIVVGTTSTYTPTQNGDYVVVSTDANGCIDTSALFTVTNVISGIAEHLSNSLVVYPNPFTKQTTIKLLNKTDIVKEISLYNPIGQKVKLISSSINRDIITLERGNLVKGIYMLLIRTENYTSKSKLVVE